MWVVLGSGQGSAGLHPTIALTCGGLAPSLTPSRLPSPRPIHSGVRLKTRKRNIVVPHDPQVRRPPPARRRRSLAACRLPLLTPLPPPITRSQLQSFADALIDIIEDAREGLEEGDRGDAGKVLDAARKVSGGPEA